MKLTNMHGLPEVLVEAVKQSPYDNQGSWRSVTELIAPAQIAHLKRMHENEIVEDASDKLYTFGGEVVHAAVERAARKLRRKGWVAEQRIFKTVWQKKISGAYDLYHPALKELQDLKYSTAYKAKNNEAPEEWVQQTNILAHLLRTKGYEVEKIRIVLVIRDHSKREARRDPSYPQLPWAFLEVPVWSDEKAKAFLEERVRLHLKAQTEEVECTPEERWAKPTIWAVKKKGSSRAVTGGLFAIEDHAWELVTKLGYDYVVEHRPGENVRCEDYCSVSKFCKQYQRLKKNSPTPSGS